MYWIDRLGIVILANFLRHYPAYKNAAFNLTELARLCGISITAVCRYIWLLEWKRQKDNTSCLF